MTATLLYEADAWLSRDSMVLMGIFTDRKALVRAVSKWIRKRAGDNFNPDFYSEDEEENVYERYALERQMFRDWKEYRQTHEDTVNIYTVECELNEYDEIY